MNTVVNVMGPASDLEPLPDRGGSVGSFQDCRTNHCCFNTPDLANIFLRNDDDHCKMIHSSLTIIVLMMVM